MNDERPGRVERPEWDKRPLIFRIARLLACRLRPPHSGTLVARRVKPRGWRWQDVAGAHHSPIGSQIAHPPFIIHHGHEPLVSTIGSQLPKALLVHEPRMHHPLTNHSPSTTHEPRGWRWQGPGARRHRRHRKPGSLPLAHRPLFTNRSSSIHHSHGPLVIGSHLLNGFRTHTQTGTHEPHVCT